MPIWTPDEIVAEARRIAGRGMQAAARFYAGLVKQALSVPAPRRAVVSGPRSRNPGVKYYRATTPATPGAAPRKLSGRLRTSIQTEFDPYTNTARVGTNVVYGRTHELGDHKFLLPTLLANLEAISQVAGYAIEGRGGTA